MQVVEGEGYKVANESQSFQTRTQKVSNEESQSCRWETPKFYKAPTLSGTNHTILKRELYEEKVLKRKLRRESCKEEVAKLARKRKRNGWPHERAIWVQVFGWSVRATQFAKESNKVEPKVNRKAPNNLNRKTLNRFGLHFQRFTGRLGIRLPFPDEEDALARNFAWRLPHWSESPENRFCKSFGSAWAVRRLPASWFQNSCEFIWTHLNSSEFNLRETEISRRSLD